MTNTHRQLRVTPRAAIVQITADPALVGAYHASWHRVAPVIRESDSEIEVGYGLWGRLRAFSTRRPSLTLALNPALRWTVELRGGVAGLRADLCDLDVTEVHIAGGASNAVLVLPQSGQRISVDIDGGARNVVVNRPAAMPASVAIDGGARCLRIDDLHLDAVGGSVRLRSPQQAQREAVAIHVRGGASSLTVGQSSGASQSKSPVIATHRVASTATMSKEHREAQL